MGETFGTITEVCARSSFSILERIDVGETLQPQLPLQRPRHPFSILERIDVGETSGAAHTNSAISRLSVSSNGSTWVKP